jgi:hypothetical protein
MNPEQVAALLMLIADLRLQISVMAQEIARLENRPEQEH